MPPQNKKYNFYNSFITEEWLFIYNVDKNLENGETIVFDRFEDNYSLFG